MRKSLTAGAVAFGLLAGGTFVNAAPARADDCNRACLSSLVTRVLASMVDHSPEKLPLAQLYMATENSHASALGNMTAWRTITKAGKPDLLAIDERAGQAYFMLPVFEGTAKTALWGRIKVSDGAISEVEIFLSRSRGDHGFTYSADQMPKNYAKLMKPPANRQRASRDYLVALSKAAFDGSDPLEIPLAKDCQFTEVGGLVIDRGLDDVADPGGRDPNEPLGCAMPPQRPNDPKARVIAVDDELGIVVVAAVVPGKVYPYPELGKTISAFIPTQMDFPMKAQDAWIERKIKANATGLLKPTEATGEVMQVLQFYDGKLQAEQINVYLSGPDMRSTWVQP